jgi:hypothetical protein
MPGSIIDMTILPETMCCGKRVFHVPRQRAFSHLAFGILATAGLIWSSGAWNNPVQRLNRLSPHYGVA